MTENKTLWSECEHDCFIGIYKNVVSKNFCDSLIDYFESNASDPEKNESYYTSHDQYGGHLNRRDFSLNLDRDPEKFWANHINQVLFECLDEYKQTFFTFNQVNHLNHTNVYVKMQRTLPRGGYHIWHCELSGIDSVHRCLAWILYLNDVPNGEGETEFLWQGMRITPEQGTLLIWPAGFTHVHRGNPVYSTTKYLTTGWIHYDEVIKNDPNSPVFYNQDDDVCELLENTKESSKISIPKGMQGISVDYGESIG
jgi:hypothetical protein